MNESVYRAPVLRSVDVLVLGGSTAAVEAATRLASASVRVVLATPYTYVGEDVCGFMNYWPKNRMETSLGASLFPGSAHELPSPMHIKYTLEQALVRSDVSLLYMTYPTHLLRDSEGAVSGCVVANRSGYQAILAPVVIDSTDRALVGRMAGASFAPWVPGNYRARTVVVGAPPQDVTAEGMDVIELPGRFAIGDERHPAYEVFVESYLADSTPPSFARIEMNARLRSWSPDLLFAASRSFVEPSDRLERPGQESADIGALSDESLDALRCGEDAVYLLSPCADVSNPSGLADPSYSMPVGAALGEHLIRHALRLPRSNFVDIDRGKRVSVDYSHMSSGLSDGSLDVRQRTSYFRIDSADGIDVDLSRARIIGQCHVLVAGGGTAGAPAAISSSRSGAETIVLEYLFGLGGVGTEGRIGRYWFGNRVGFTTEIDQGVAGMGPNPRFSADDGEWQAEWKKQWYLREVAAAGGVAWFGSMATAAVIRGKRVAGAAVATPFGYGLVVSDASIDSTGNADLAAAAGAEIVQISKAHVAVQGAGLAPNVPGRDYENTDHTFIDDTDVADITRAFVVARRKFRDEFDLAQMIDTRERRQVIGEVSLTPLDFLSGRTFSDTIVSAESNFDSHGFTIHPLFMAKPPHEEPLRAHVPFRSLLPVGLEGIIVTGLGVSAHRDALPVIRMQPDVQNQGYAVGRVAALAAFEGSVPRAVDIKGVQRHLVDIGILDPAVVTRADTADADALELGRAVSKGIDTHQGLALIFSVPEEATPLLKEAHDGTADSHRRLLYARVLGLIGSDAGIDTLLAELDGTEWDQGWDYTGMGQFGFSLSEVDTLLIAAARSGSARAETAILAKLESLEASHAFSHLRAATLAVEARPIPQAAQHFSRILGSEGLRGAWQANLTSALETADDDPQNTTERNRQLKELLIARGLYACGDPHGVARRVLEAYKKGLHGHYARHAKAILDR